MKPKFNRAYHVSPLSRQTYGDYLPIAFDESFTILEKLNKVIYNLNQLGTISNGVVDKWNEFIDWLEAGGVGDEVLRILEQWLDEGKFHDIITEAVLGDVERIKQVLSEFDKLREDVDSITQTSGNAVYQQLMMRPFFGMGTEQIFEGAENAPQGLAYVKYKDKEYLFVLSRVSGTTWTDAELHRITQFELKKDGTTGMALAYTKPLRLGHQGLSALVDNDKIWLFAGYGYGDFENNGKGYTKIEWKGSNTDECDIYRYKILGAHGSSERYNEYNHATPAISTDGQYVVLAVATTYEANTRYALVFDRKQVERAENPMSVPALNIFQLDAPPYVDSHIVQDLATDGNYIYVYTGGVAPSLAKCISIYSLQGYNIGYYKLDGGLALYDSLTNDSRYGDATQMEPEGLTIRGSTLLALSTDVWQKDGQYTKRDKLVYKIYRGCANCEGEPINSGKQPIISPASLHIRGTSHDISFPYGDGFTISQWKEDSGQLIPSLSYNGQYLFRIYDTRPNSWTNEIPMTFRNNKAAPNNSWSEIRTGATLEDGAGINLYDVGDGTGARAGRLLLYATNPADLTSSFLMMYGSGALVPGTDNTSNLGDGSRRFRTIYAGTANINTSDERHKQQIKPIDDKVLDAWNDVKFYQYKFNDAVAEKGEENARWHFGVLAQEIERVFKEHGLDAFEYGLIGYDEWEAEDADYDVDGREISPARPAGNIYSIRPTECQWLELALMRRKMEQLG